MCFAPGRYHDRAMATRLCAEARMRGEITMELVEAACRPVDYVVSLAGEPYPALLESSLCNTRLGRYSILCWDPFKRITCRGEAIEVHAVVMLVDAGTQ